MRESRKRCDVHHLVWDRSEVFSSHNEWILQHSISHGLYTASVVHQRLLLVRSLNLWNGTVQLNEGHEALRVLQIQSLHILRNEVRVKEYFKYTSS
jgi:hypothetical protein